MKMLMAHFGNFGHGFSGAGIFLFLLVAGLLLFAVFSLAATSSEKK